MGGGILIRGEIYGEFSAFVRFLALVFDVSL